MNVPVVVLEPGDRVLVVLDADTDPEQIDRVQQGLRKRFPAVQFSLLAGADAVYVEPKDAPK